jgi:hypothetical protein
MDPFSEIALRSQADYDNSSRVWLNVLRPRFDVLVGAPQLSQHLALSVGASLRPVAAFQEKDGSFSYHYFMDSGQHGQFAEASLAIQYIP